MKIVKKIKSNNLDNNKEFNSNTLLNLRKKGDPGGSLARSPLKILIDDMLGQNMDSKAIAKILHEKHGLKIDEDRVTNYKKHYFLKDRKAVQDNISNQIIATQLQTDHSNDLGTTFTDAPSSIKETIKIIDIVKSRIFVLRREIDDITQTIKFDITGYNVSDKKSIDAITKQIMMLIQTNFARRLKIEELINDYIHTLTNLQQYVAKYEVESTEKAIKASAAQQISEIALTFFLPILQSVCSEEQIQKNIEDYSKKIEEYLKR